MAASSVSNRSNKTARRVLPIRTHTTGGLSRRSRWIAILVFRDDRCSGLLSPIPNFVVGRFAQAAVSDVLGTVSERFEPSRERGGS